MSLLRLVSLFDVSLSFSCMKFAAFLLLGRLTPTCSDIISCICPTVPGGLLSVLDSSGCSNIALLSSSSALSPKWPFRLNYGLTLIPISGSSNTFPFLRSSRSIVSTTSRFRFLSLVSPSSEKAELGPRFSKLSDYLFCII